MDDIYVCLIDLFRGKDCVDFTDAKNVSPDEFHHERQGVLTEEW